MNGQPGGILRRLARDRGGNTMAMMAAFLLPLSALAGSAVDAGRLYLVKIRLQQACDAGALAGRKFMIDSNDTTLDANAVTQAKVFFAQNFPSGLMGTPTYKSITRPYPFVPSKTADNQVTATATMSVPMTIMKMFGQTAKSVTVTCEARYDVADTDIVFVLDTTGSMACKPERTDSECSNYIRDKGTSYTNPGNSDGVPGYAGTTGYTYTEETNGSTNVSRIQAVRTAVASFYNTIAANVDSSTHIRYGFVTYSSMVNAGKAIMDVSPSYIIGGSGSGSTSWTYQSRRKTGEYVAGTLYQETGYNQTQCGQQPGNVRTPSATPSDAYPFDPNTGTATRINYIWTKYTKGNQTYTGCLKQTDTLGPQWTYQPVSYDVSGFASGNAVTDPSRVNGATTRWLGCIEERDTTAGSTSFDSDALPPDLDPNLVPSTDASRWRPFWPDVEYYRPTYNQYPTSNGDSGTYYGYGLPDQLDSGFAPCGKPIQRLKVMTADDVSAYVNADDFKPLGGTYHDVGMIWGTRLLSSTGIFAADTAAWPGRPAPKRVIVFLTDGVMSPNDTVYGLYGVENLDRRVSGGSGTLKDYHNARFQAECSKAKAMDIDVWTVAISPTADAQLTSCASSSAKALYTTSGSQLDTYFRQIAQQVALLRVSK